MDPDCDVLDAAAELTDHLGYEPGDPRPSSNARARVLPQHVRRLGGFNEAVVSPYANGLVAMWERSWAEFVPFLDFPVEIGTLIYTTNGSESLNRTNVQYADPDSHDIGQPPHPRWIRGGQLGASSLAATG
jgi:transposase-like protein